MPTTIGRAFIPAFKLLMHLLCRIDAAELARVPEHGPLIIATNHIGILEIPILYTHLQPRHFAGFVASYRWRKRWLGWVLDQCDAIPLTRGEVDLNAIRRALDWLEVGGILAIAPEGTRSFDGRLQPAHAGVVLLAEKSGAPVLPLAFYGSENFEKNISHLRRTDFIIRVGELVAIDVPKDAAKAGITRHQLRQQIADNIMRRIAAMMPVKYHGVYAVPS